MRVSDGSVLQLIRLWLSAVVVEPGEAGGPPKATRQNQGVPQGGVISPLRANLYLHWFDVKFHRAEGPYRWANARRVRYADDLVIMARYIGPCIREFAESTLEGWMGLTINQGKTRTIRVTDPGSILDFPGFTFRHDRNLYGRAHWYLNICPSREALTKEREVIRQLTGRRNCFKLIRLLIDQLNLQTAGWKNYFDKGYPRQVLKLVDRIVYERLVRHLKRRSQRACRRPEGTTWAQYLHHLGWMTAVSIAG